MTIRVRILAFMSAALLLPVVGAAQTYVNVEPPQVHVEVQPPSGPSAAEIAAAIAAEQDKRDAAARREAELARRGEEMQEADRHRMRKLCLNIPESARARDPSVRRMCEGS